VNATSHEQLGKVLYKVTGGGADYAFDCVGLGKVTEQAWNVLRRGGMAVTVGRYRRTTGHDCAQHPAPRNQ
jgi:threonine dehydrogenase-like Zn-dependent dehydrogenase